MGGCLLRAARHPAQYSETLSTIRRGAPILREHTREVLAESGFAPDEIDEFERSGAAYQASDEVLGMRGVGPEE